MLFKHQPFQTSICRFIWQFINRYVCIEFQMELKLNVPWTQEFWLWQNTKRWVLYFDYVVLKISITLNISLIYSKFLVFRTWRKISLWPPSWNIACGKCLKKKNNLKLYVNFQYLVLYQFLFFWCRSEI